MTTAPQSLRDLLIRPAEAADTVPLLALIHQMAAYEELSHEVTATATRLRATLFGERPAAEALIAATPDGPVGCALFFHTISTFLAQPGLYVEDIFGIGIPCFRLTPPALRASPCRSPGPTLRLRPSGFERLFSPHGTCGGGWCGRHHRIASTVIRMFTSLPTTPSS